MNNLNWKLHMSKSTTKIASKTVQTKSAATTLYPAE